MMNKKFRLIISLLICVLSILIFSNKTYAIEGVLEERHYVSDRYVNGGTITYTELDRDWELYCRQKGQHIYSGTGGVPYEKTSEADLTNGDFQTKDSYTGTAGSSDITNGKSYWTFESDGSDIPGYDKTYIVNSASQYTAEGEKIATPKEAYILSFSELNNGSHYNDAQRAWWTTDAGSTGQAVPDNDLSLAGKAYELFVKKLAKNPEAIKDTSKYVMMSHTSGNETYSVPFPELNPDKLNVTFNEVNKTGDSYEVVKTGDKRYGRVEVNWNQDEGTFVVGPFSINYIEGAYGETKFGFINSFKLFNQDDKEISTDDWEFVWIEGQRESSDKYEYPHSDEVFYIKVKYNDSLKSINNMEVEYKYLICGGTYVDLEGEAIQDTYELVYKESTTVGSGDDQKTKYRYEWKKIGSKGLESQRLNAVANVARWYESNITKTKFEPAREGELKITKKVTDENGTELTSDQIRDMFGANQYFKFKYVIKYANGEQDTDHVLVRAGESVTVGPFIWYADENAPTYEVQELDFTNNYWQKVSISNDRNSLVEKSAQEVIAINKTVPTSNSIKIKKKLSSVATEDVTFKFNVLITENNGKEHKEDAEITIAKGSKESTVWESQKYKWYGENAPEYFIEEVETDTSKNYEAIITPNKGSLGDTKDPIEVEALNNTIIKDHKNKIKIKKLLTQKSDVNQTFKFNVKVEGFADEIAEVTVNAGQTEANWESREYEWSDNEEAPKYSIEEIEHDAKYIPIISPRNGRLDENEPIIEVVAINTYYSNKINLEKHTSVPTDADEVFKFKVTVSNLYDINGEALPDSVEYVIVNIVAGQTTGTTKWYDDDLGLTPERTSSKTYEWWNSENAPKYKVEELVTGDSEKYNPVITPEEGTLADNGVGVEIKVTAVNKRNKKLKNFIQINKVLTQAATEDETFKFKVNVAGAETGTPDVEAVITIKKGEKSGDVWLSGEYTWNEDDPAPVYSISEVNPGKYKCKLKDSNGNESDASGVLTGRLDGQQAKVIAEATNNYYENKIKIRKVLTEPADQDETFTFKVNVDGYPEETASITVKKGETTSDVWVSATTYSWTDGVEGPAFEIKEELSDPSKYKPEINPSKGKLNGETTEINVTAKNVSNEHKGFLVLEKLLENGQVSAQEFKFNIKVEGSENDSDFDVVLKGGEKAGPYTYLWRGDEAPKFTITELDDSDITNVNMTADNATNVSKSGRTISGRLTAEGEAKVEVRFTNTLKDHKCKIDVEKAFKSEEKMTNDQIKEFAKKNNVSFKGKITVMGTFKYKNNVRKNSSEVIEFTLSPSNDYKFSSDEITWYGNVAPTYIVEETDVGQGFLFRSIEYTNAEPSQDTGEGVGLVEGTNKAIITNFLPSTERIVFTFKMGGLVWVDKTLDEKNADGYYNSYSNGVYDNGEELKENVEVTVYKVFYKGGTIARREVAEAYLDSNETPLTFPLITKSDGKWRVPQIKVAVLTDSEKQAGYTAAAYDVEFVYDGQTYDSVECLSYMVDKDTNGNVTGANKLSGSNSERANSYISATKSQQKKYFYDSMAEKYSNNSDNISDVYGGSEINANGDSVGYVTYSGEEKAVKYISNNAGDDYPTISQLVTTNADGLTLNIFRATASTATASPKLTYPFDVDNYNGCKLTGTESKYTVNGIENKYTFKAVYNSALNINLGLKEREKLDIALTKNLTTAKVIVNEKMYQYNYSGLYDLTEVKTDSLNKDIFVSDSNNDLDQTLSAYITDYYYRSEMYNTRLYNVLNSLDEAYNTFGQNAQDSEMDIYLSYTLKVKNNSSSYSVTINSIDDYYDNSFELVRATEKKYIKTQTIGTGGAETNINDTIDVVTGPSHGTWNDVAYGLSGSDKDKNDANILYNKMTATDLNINLGSGESQDIVLTFKVKKNTDSNNVRDSIVLGLKSNVAEISKYSTSGKIDRDSAPGNVNITALNAKKWYEDDTFAAPRININLIDPPGTRNASRTVTGTVWEDNSKDSNTENVKYNHNVGNGIKDSGEEEIEGLKTNFVEKVILRNTAGEYIENDFIWPTSDTTIPGYGGHSIEELTGFKSTMDTDGNGDYLFEHVPTGDFIVRFNYGEKKIQSQDYSTAEFYNGQDYKSATYKAIIKNDTDGTKYLRPDDYIDINAMNANSSVLNAAADNEVRRLEVIDLSRELTNYNTYELGKYTNKVFSDYYMFADTAKLSISQNSTEAKNINCAIEERPQTVLSLDKQIQEITVITSDGAKLLNARYNINYTIDTSGITVHTELDELNSIGTENLQVLNRDEATNQGFRYINIDEDIIEGATVNVKYKFTVFNTGEVDRTSSALSTYDYNISLRPVWESLKQQNRKYTKVGSSLVNDSTIGTYVGSVYYYGANSSEKENVADEPLVTTKVRQVLDYIDNDISFAGSLNLTQNMSWSNVTPRMLERGDLIDSNILKRNSANNVSTDALNNYEILDENGMNYLTEKKNNLIVSVDEDDSANSINNSGFIIDLLPYESGEDNYLAAMELVSSKYIGSDSGNLTIDNISEIIKYNNRVGRKDELAITGNTDPAVALEKDNSLIPTSIISNGMKYERDASVTEVITLSPPTGSAMFVWRLQVLSSITFGLLIVAGGIIIIKKKVLTK